MRRAVLLLAAALTSAAPPPAAEIARLPRACPGRGVSDPLTVSRDGAVIENLVFNASGQAAIRVVGARNVTLRNLTIYHAGAEGIAIIDAPGARIENVDIYNLGAPDRGAARTAAEINILCQGSRGLQVRNARLQRGSSGVYLLGCHNSRLEGLEGRDFRGPFPRGQLVQWDKSNGGALTDFSALNSIARSWPEDIVNVYQSSNVAIARGVVDGNNSVSGDGVLVDEGSHDVTITDVEALRQMNGCFGVYGGGGYNVTMLRTRCRNTICRSPRGRPLSNSLAWAVDPRSTGNIRILKSGYANLCNPDNILWEDDEVSAAEIVPLRNQPLRTPYRATLCSA